MAITATLVGTYTHDNFDGSGNHTITLTGDLDPGDIALLVYGADAGDADPAVPELVVTDPGGNTWSTALAADRNGASGATLIHAVERGVITTQVTSGQTLTVAAAGWWRTSITAAVVRIRGAGSPIIDSATTDLGSTSAPNGGTVTTPDATEHIVVGSYCSGVRTHTPAAGYTELAELGNGGTQPRQTTVVSRVVTSAGNWTPGGSFSSPTTTVGGSLLFASATTVTAEHMILGGVLTPVTEHLTTAP